MIIGNPFGERLDLRGMLLRHVRHRHLRNDVNNLMVDGKKSIAYTIFYDALDIVGEKMKDADNAVRARHASGSMARAFQRARDPESFLSIMVILFLRLL